VEGLSNLLTANDALAKFVIKSLEHRVDDLTRMRALGFCVSVEHARFMARVFREAGVAAPRSGPILPIQSAVLRW